MLDVVVEVVSVVVIGIAGTELVAPNVNALSEMFALSSRPVPVGVSPTDLTEKSRPETSSAPLCTRSKVT